LDIIGRIAAELAVEPREIYRIAISASARYREILLHVPGKKERVVHQPSSELRLIQRWCVDRLFHVLPVHESCFSYAKGRNIAMHALAHAPNNYLSRIDIRQFFPSLERHNVVSLLSGHRNLLKIETDREVEIVSSLVTRFGRLVIGAPSSPILSNALMYEFDRKWWRFCNENKVTYTRYADDIYLSTKVPNISSGILKDLKGDLVGLPSFNFSINTEKNIFTSRKRLRRVTGVVLTPGGRLSIGWTQKRKLKSLVYQALQHNLEGLEIQRILGMLSHIDSVDPEFSRSLQRKYGVTYREQLKSLLGGERRAL
jgi:hypothetical protein